MALAIANAPEDDARARGLLEGTIRPRDAQPDGAHPVGITFKLQDANIYDRIERGMAEQVLPCFIMQRPDWYLK